MGEGGKNKAEKWAKKEGASKGGGMKETQEEKQGI